MILTLKAVQNNSQKYTRRWQRFSFYHWTYIFSIKYHDERPWGGSIHRSRHFYKVINQSVRELCIFWFVVVYDYDYDIIDYVVSFIRNTASPLQAVFPIFAYKPGFRFSQGSQSKSYQILYVQMQPFYTAYTICNYLIFKPRQRYSMNNWIKSKHTK